MPLSDVKSLVAKTIDAICVQRVGYIFEIPKLFDPMVKTGYFFRCDCTTGIESVTWH